MLRRETCLREPSGKACAHFSAAFTSLRAHVSAMSETASLRARPGFICSAAAAAARPFVHAYAALTLRMASTLVRPSGGAATCAKASADFSLPQRFSVVSLSANCSRNDFKFSAALSASGISASDKISPMFPKAFSRASTPFRPRLLDAGRDGSGRLVCLCSGNDDQKDRQQHGRNKSD